MSMDCVTYKNQAKTNKLTFFSSCYLAVSDILLNTQPKPVLPALFICFLGANICKSFNITNPLGIDFNRTLITRICANGYVIAG